MDPKQPETPKRKLPEFIVIDDARKEYREKKEEPREFYPKPKAEVSGKIRFVCFLASFMTSLWAIGSLLGLLLAGSLVLITFNTFTPFKKAFFIYWSWFKGAVVATLGLLVAVFNFALGMMIIMFYFSQVQENSQRNMFRRYVQPHVDEFFS